MHYEWVIRGGREAGRQIALTAGQMVTLGRLKVCDVQLEDESVSRRHCTIHARDGACVVSDLQSANGTFVNEKRITTADLKLGDKLRVGATEIEVVATAGPREAGASATLPFSLVGEPRGYTLVRKAVDPAKLEFLAQAVSRQNDQSLLASAQRYLSTLQHVSDVMSRASGLESLFDAILSEILEVTQGDRAAILMREPQGESETDVKVAAVRTRSGAAAAGMVLSRTVVGDVLEHGISSFSHDALSDERYVSGESVVRQRIRSVMCVPMRTSEEILGVLYVDSQSTHEFSEAELELLAAIGNQAGIAVHRTRLLSEVEQLFLDVTKAIAAIIDAKDGYTHRHSERVAAFAVKMAAELGLSIDERSVIELSALLHDVGKIGVPDAILNKPGKLTDEEFEEMRRHPAHGAAILANIQSAKVAELLPGIKHHHERWDGSGYPDGLKGEEIPLIGRILAVADFVDALTSDRAYRKGQAFDEVMDMVRARAGTAFDPKVVEAALALHEKGELVLPVAPGPALR